MNTGAIILMIVSISVVLIGTAVLSYRLNKKNEGTWAVQKTPLIVTIGTTFATAIGGGVLTYHIGLGYQYGWSALSYGICQGGGIFLVILMAKWLRENEFDTIPTIFKELYGESKFLTVLVAIASVVTPFGWIAGQCTAFGKLFSAITGLSVPFLTVIFAIVCLAFVLPNGFGTVAWTDAIFGFILCGICIGTVFYSTGMAGGWSNVVASVPAEIVSFPSGMVAVGGAQLALWAMSVLPGQPTNQMYIQRVSSVRNVKDIYKALGISCVLVFAADIFASMVGMSIRTVMPGLAAEEVFGWFLTQLPLWFTCLIVGMIGAAVMSTCDSAVQTTAVCVVYDIYHKVINPNADEKQLKNLSRVVCALALFISVILGLRFPSVLNLITTGYSYGVAMLLVPMYVGYYLRKKNFTTRIGCYCSIIGGAVGCVIFQLNPVGSIPFAMFGLIFSLVGLVVGSMLTRNRKESAV